MSLKAGNYIRDAGAKTAEAVQGGVQSASGSAKGSTGSGAGAGSFGATASERMRSLGQKAVAGSAAAYDATRTAAAGVLERFAGGGLAAECTRESKCARE